MRSAAGGAARPRDRQQVVVGPGVEQGVFGQRARRHQPHHAAADHALVAALARLGRVLHLLADRDAVAERDQAMQIVLGALHRHAAHRDIGALVPAALGQHDAERPGGDLGVLEEQFVEIAHPVEQQQFGMRGLDLQKLFHHRRHARGVLRWRSGLGRNGDGLLDRHCAANYKILLPGPIALPRQSAFSTLQAARRAPSLFRGHSHPAPKRRSGARHQLTCREGAPKTRHPAGQPRKS